ncbi:hypothetical protein AVEN_96721-1 [Araneus ventricosus]|uniref:Uncharacterized protein n=1 Tax=Araneus ventricosus TaxID=182803 RepID=A0A4Y2EAX7_ARAVE|nr:hypothetical protein AVEN_96721-1 [Araneus ventricosus]
MTSKPRVAHLKQISIPRLELCGAVLVTELTKKVKQALEIEKADIHFWIDSTIVISFIQRESRDLKILVENRVSKIQQRSSCDHWHHIALAKNSATIISRGLFPEELRENSLWW